MLRGVDITKVDLLPLEFSGIHGFESLIVKLTCDKGRTWISSNGKVYDLPDQIWQITSLPGGWLSADVELYKSSKELKKSFGFEVGVGVNTLKYAFSASVSYTSMQHSITNSSKYISDVGAFVSANTAEMVPIKALSLDNHTKSYVDNELTGTYETNPKAYNDFIDTFGTHFFYRANFGGYIRAIYRTDSKYFFSHSEDWVKATAKASYMSTISVSVNVSTSIKKIDTNFTKSTSEKIHYGGNTNLLAQGNGLAVWQPTVVDDPWMFSGKLKPISDLFTETTKKSSMERAVEQYLLRSYVDELERLINYAISKSNDAVLKSLQTRIKNLKKMRVLVKNDVDVVGEDIDYQIKPPLWFMTSTKLCFTWLAVLDSTQCGGGVSNNLCATPNSMTQFYWDNTDFKLGGCKMQWGITSIGYPDWFNHIQVCFKWFSEIPFYGNVQCGANWAGAIQKETVCSKLNKFTSSYIDNTNGIPGGCLLSWKLEVPSDAPLWMRTSQMCFSWYPDEPNDECGVGAPSRYTCANANDWTPNYRDNTYDLEGGCRMSWGIKTLFF